MGFLGCRSWKREASANAWSRHPEVAAKRPLEGCGRGDRAVALRGSSLRDEHLRVTETGQRIERLGKKAKHESGIGRGEDAGALSLERIGAGRSGGDVERPAEVFARVAQTDFDAVKAKRFAVQRAHQRELFAKRRRRFALSGFQITSQLAGKPRTPLRAAT